MDAGRPLPLPRHRRAGHAGTRPHRTVAAVSAISASQDGYFHLNGKRLFLRAPTRATTSRSASRSPCCPDHVRRDMIFAKASGFNCVRFIAGVAWPEQLDFCDEIGMMVYEECYAGWCWGLAADGRAVRPQHAAMIRRDRNHPSVAIWGLLNETFDGPVFRQAVGFLPKLRALDPTRLVLLSSGRWDCHRPSARSPTRAARRGSTSGASKGRTRPRARTVDAPQRRLRRERRRRARLSRGAAATPAIERFLRTWAATASRCSSPSTASAA